MNADELGAQVGFGLENLDKIYKNILKFSSSDFDQDLKVSALSYECLGYYNAIEHLMIRFLKFFMIEVPSGAFSHRDIIQEFQKTIVAIKADDEIIKAIEDLMGFRHVATKIYGFLLDWQKLKRLTDQILKYHADLKQIFMKAIDLAGKK